MRFLTRILALSITAAVAAPAMASANGPVLLAPPGNSAISQYAEVVPSDLGATPPRAGGPVGSGARRLDRLGADGRLLAAVVSATAPPPAVSAGSPAGRTAVGSAHVSGAEAGGTNRAPDAATPLASAGAASPASDLLSAAGGGLGIVLAVLALGAGVLVVVRAIRRRSEQ